MATIRNGLLEDMLLDYAANGWPTAKFCRDMGVSRASVYNWLADDEAFATRYRAAREVGFDALAEDCMAIADDASLDTIETDKGLRADKEWIARSKLRVETRLKLLACWSAGKYGQAVKVDATVRQTSVTMPADMPPTDAARIYQDFMRGAD